MMTSTSAKTVAAYIADAPKESRALLRQMRALIKAAAPDAVEKISYGMPGYKLEGRAFAYFAANKQHLGFYPASGSFLKAYASALLKQHVSKGAVHFSYDKPLPVALIRKMLKARVAQLRGKGRAD